jgi:FdhE protein
MSTLQELERRNPQWRPWLALVGKVVAELDDPAWDAAVPACAPPAAGAPLLAAAAVSFDVGPMARLREKLANGADPQALAVLLPLPLLHACRRRWVDAIPQAWPHGYCPVCGAWPAFAEVCGVERSRYLRCGRCGAAWRAHALWCPYCGNAEHDALASLLAEQGASRWTIDVCNRCLGYIKTLTRLQPGPPAQGLIDDLASVELDIAAKQRGYVRPDGPGYALA